MTRDLEAEVAAEHRSLFGSACSLFSAPGRVNLIGEHTDYSDGFVLPAAIDFRTVVGITPRSDGQLSLRSVDLEETVSGAVADLIRAPKKRWSDYPVGVLRILTELGVDTSRGCDLTIAGDVPLGAGLSSSASLEVATAVALVQTLGSKLSSKDLALACQRAENSFVGAKCGIMDQFIAMHGEADHALLIDCRSLEFTPIPLPGGVELILCNSMVKHSVAGGEYSTRRSELEQGTELLRRFRPEIRKLRDANEDDLARFGSSMPDAVLRRCRHVVSENRRVLEFVEACKQEDLVRMGTLMNDSYLSYRDDFEASCPEVEVLIRAAQRQSGCHGSRLTGGGFGGCTVSLVDSEYADRFVESVREQYFLETSISAEIYRCVATDGAQRFLL